MTEEEENEILARRGQEALADPNNIATPYSIEELKADLNL